MIPWRNAKTATATVVDIRECDKIMDRLADDAMDEITSILMTDSFSITDAKSMFRTLIENAKSGIQSMAEEVRLIKE